MSLASLNFPDGCLDVGASDTGLLACELFVIAGRFTGSFVADSVDCLLALLPAQEQETSNNDDPVQVIRDNRAICRAVLPSKQRIENAPASVSVFERRAALVLSQHSVHTIDLEIRTLTCHTLFLISYDPGPAPASATPSPANLTHASCSRFHTPLENRPAATRYKKQVETTRKICRDVLLPPL
jgi:hypothetical protein